MEERQPVCPLRMITFDSQSLATPTHIDLMSPVEGIPPSPFCLGGLCQFWDGDRCIIFNIGVFLAGISEELQTIRDTLNAIEENAK